MKFIIRFLPLFKNKYFIATTSFAVWVIFFDVNNLFSQLESQGKLNELKQSQQYYEAEIKKHHKEIEDLSINIPDTLTDRERIKTLERFARETYLMKKDNEDIFVIETKVDTTEE